MQKIILETLVTQEERSSKRTKKEKHQHPMKTLHAMNMENKATSNQIVPNLQRIVTTKERRITIGRPTLLGMTMK